MAKLELPTIEQVRDIIRDTIPKCHQAFSTIAMDFSGWAGMDPDSSQGPFDEIKKLIDSHRGQVHAKLDELLDLTIDRTRLHELLDVALNAARDGLDSYPEGFPQQDEDVNYCEMCGQEFPILDPAITPP
jgi:hypothetical protein